MAWQHMLQPLPDTSCFMPLQISSSEAAFQAVPRQRRTQDAVVQARQPGPSTTDRAMQHRPPARALVGREATSDVSILAPALQTQHQQTTADAGAVAEQRPRALVSQVGDDEA